MISLRVFTWIKGRYVGTDSYGNKYYRERFLFMKPNRRPKRWVIFKGVAEGSKVPAEWYGWLHYSLEEPIRDRQKYFWEKPHRPNLTGTSLAYLPSKHSLKLSGDKKSKNSNYDAWVPKKTVKSKPKVKSALKQKKTSKGKK